MKCLANRKQFQNAVNRETTEAVKPVTRYFTAVTCDILFNRLGWSCGAVERFMLIYQDEFIAVHENHDDKGVGCSFEDIKQTLAEDYGYTPSFKNSAVNEHSRSVRRRVEENTDRCVEWLASVVALIMFDKFGTSEKTVERFMAAYNTRIKDYRKGADFKPICDKIKAEHGFDLLIEVI